MKRFPVITAALLLSMSVVTGAGASLVGDDVIVQWVQNDVVLQSDPVTIQEGTDDIITTGFNQVRVNIEADTVIIDFFGVNDLPQGFSTFFGIKILGLEDVDNPDWVLLDATVTNNTMTSSAQWFAEEESRLLIDPVNGNVGFDWHQMSYRPGQNFTAMLEFGPSPIPIPATMALFVTGLIGFILIRNKKKGEADDD